MPDIFYSLTGGTYPYIYFDYCNAFKTGSRLFETALHFCFCIIRYINISRIAAYKLVKPEIKAEQQKP